MKKSVLERVVSVAHQPLIGSVKLTRCGFLTVVAALVAMQVLGEVDEIEN